MTPTPRRVMMTVDAVGGVWRYAVDLCRSLSERGVETVLVVMGPPPSPDLEAEVRTIGGVQLVVLGGSLDWMADAGEADIATIPPRLAALAAELDVDLLHLNLPTQAVDIPTDKPVVVAAHSCLATWWNMVRGDEPFPQAWRWHLAATRAGLQRADAVIAPSRAHASGIRAAYGHIDYLHTVHNASAGIADTGAPSPAAFALAAGRWWDDAKNLATLDEAAGLCRWPIRIAGALNGPGGERREATHAQPVGHLSRPDMARLVRSAPIFVSPALYEPFGLAVLEAALGGSALVLSDIASFRELWSDAAVFVPARDAAALAAAIDRLADDPDERQRLGHAAHDRAQRYNLSAQADATLAVYAEAVQRVPAPVQLQTA
ncbi:glycosyltransferase family 4 protein [Terrihabitans rhizophilus]|nr:glycosyltransferase family 4 protein [Terrihabitans sp. PJ23]